MIRIGNTYISNFYIKVLIFIVLPLIYIIYSYYSFEYTEQDFRDNMTRAQKIYLETSRLESFQELYEGQAGREEAMNRLETMLFALGYFLIAVPLLLITDKQMRSTQAGRFVAQYIKWELIENYFKVKSREYEIKDLEHEQVKHDFEHKRKMKDLEYLAPLALINFNNAKTEIEKARAAILRDSINYMYKMSDRWRAYVYSSVMGGAGTPREDADLQDEINRIKLEIELEELRKKKMDNDDRQDKYDTQKGL